MFFLNMLESNELDRRGNPPNRERMEVALGYRIFWLLEVRFLILFIAGFLTNVNLGPEESRVCKIIFSVEDEITEVLDKTIEANGREGICCLESAEAISFL